MQSGPALWLIVLTIGVLALGLAIAYGMRKNASRTPAEERLSEAAAQREIKREDLDAR